MVRSDLGSPFHTTTSVGFMKNQGSPTIDKCSQQRQQAVIGRPESNHTSRYLTILLKWHQQGFCLIKSYRHCLHFPPLVILNMNWLARTKPDETLLLKCMLPHRVILRRRFRRLAHPSFVQSVPTNKSRCGKNNLHFNDSHLSVTNQKMSPVPAERTHSNITRSVSVFRPF